MARSSAHDSFQPGQEVTHARYGWPGRLSHREGGLWSVVWLAEGNSPGWSFSLKSEDELRPLNRVGSQLKLLEEIPEFSSGSPDYPA